MNFFKNITREKVNFCAASLLVFSLPFYRWVSTYFIALWIVTWLVEGNFISKFKENIGSYLLYIPVAFYFVHVISIFYSTNKPEAYFDLEVKLSFFLFPIIFMTSNKLYREKFEILLKVFVYANLIAAIICIINAFVQSISFKNGVFVFNHDLINLGYSTTRLFMIGGTRFMYTSLSMFNHPGYFSLYVNFSIAIILFVYLGDKRLKRRFLWIIIFVFFVIFNYLLFSRAGIISFLIIITVYFIYSIIKSKTQIIKIMKSAFLVGFISLGVLYISLNGRMQTAFKEAVKFRFDKSFIKDNNDDRIPIWYVTGLIIEDNILTGVGNGDIKDDLKIKYKEYGLTEAYKLELNVHNQFLETFLGTGLIGFILIFMMMMIPIVAGFKNHNILQIIFFVVFSIFMVVESAFDGQAGVVFFAFFYSLFSVSRKKLIFE